MSRQENFPPKSWTTRYVFIGIIALLGLALLIGVVVGPALVESNVDPRPYAAILSGATYLALFAALGWFAWKALGGRR